ncbi:hypothetical protein [Plantibacter sp. CFBP 13570]|uniref:hypothetical protein n=1 Tax=Plantibacter sp. CFBP 13570 TaxID=2775272 RepID=UPI001930D2DB|nr:hypothetical protein [Plantibacter sp. CFBP 13570]MBD8534421.1 hypothetical protein [Plantibacter sp. CFBP 13570]
MNIDNEDALKKKMGIDSWRNLSKDKFMMFVSELPNMSKEVALKVVEQFPDFKSLVMESLTEVQSQATSGLKANWKSQKKVHKAFADYRKTLNRELDREGLTSDDRLAILALLTEAIDREAAKDSEHKMFVFKIVGAVGTVAMFSLAAAVAVLGVKTEIGGDNT